MKGTTYRVVGHRGYPQKFPENSMVGFVAAADAGVDAIELDVQVSRDGHLMVFHDATLDRVTDATGYIWEYSATELTRVSCHEPARFSNQFKPTPIVSLREVCDVLAQFDVHVFVEAKVESFAHISRSDFLKKLLADTKPLSHRSLISFDFDILERAKGRIDIGWVLAKLGHEEQQKSYRLCPNVLIADVRSVTSEKQLFSGDWDWFLYDIVDPIEARFWFERGVKYIETWDAQALR